MRLRDLEMHHSRLLKYRIVRIVFHLLSERLHFHVRLVLEHVVSTPQKTHLHLNVRNDRRLEQRTYHRARNRPNVYLLDLTLSLGFESVPRAHLSAFSKEEPHDGSEVVCGLRIDGRQLHAQLESTYFKIIIQMGL